MTPHFSTVHLVGSAILWLALSLASGEIAAAIVTVMSAKSTEAPLSRREVEDIFLGKTSRFPDGSPAVPIDQAEGSAAREEFYLKLSGKSPAQLKAYWSKIIFTGRGQPAMEVANSAEVKKRLAENPNAIGYIEQNLVDRSVRVLFEQ